jgi:hypothetical protein
MPLPRVTMDLAASVESILGYTPGDDGLDLPPKDTPRVAR